MCKHTISRSEHITLSIENRCKVIMILNPVGEKKKVSWNVTSLPSLPPQIKLIILYMCAKIKYLTPAAKPLCIHICTTVITVVQLSAITFYDLTFLLNIFPKNDQALYHNEYYRHYLSLTGHWKLTFCVLCIIFLRRIR